jgi:hypothetical protein
MKRVRKVSRSMLLAVAGCCFLESGGEALHGGGGGGHRGVREVVGAAVVAVENEEPDGVR